MIPIKFALWFLQYWWHKNRCESHVVHNVPFEIRRWTPLKQETQLGVRHPKQVTQWHLNRRQYETTCWSIMIYTDLSCVFLKHFKKHDNIARYISTVHWRPSGRTFVCFWICLKNIRGIHTLISWKNRGAFHLGSTRLAHIRQSRKPKTFNASGKKLKLMINQCSFAGTKLKMHMSILHVNPNGTHN